MNERFCWTDPNEIVITEPVPAAVKEETMTDDKPKLRLIGEDGNAFNLLGLARRAALAAGWPKERWEKVRDRATAGNYDHLLAVLMEEFDVS